MTNGGAAKQVLVTGGTGYIGSHTVIELISSGYSVTVIDNLSNSYPDVLAAVETITGIKPFFARVDLCDKDAVAAVIRERNIESVIHFAAFKSVNESVSSPLSYYRNNLLSLINLTELCAEFNISNFVFSSSCSVYGEPDHVPVNEFAEIKPAQSPYANTKKIGEDILRDVVHASSLKVIALRYFNPVGAHSSALLGELALGQPLNLFPVVTQAAIGRRGAMMVYGDDYDTPDGSCIRDYIHVMDIAAAHVAAIRRLENQQQKNNYELFNLGTGQGLSVLEVIHAFEKYTGVKVPYKITSRREGDVIKVYADTAYANRELGWKATRTLEEMITSAWAWEKNLHSKNAAMQ